MTITDRRPELAALVEKILAEESLGEDFGFDIAPMIMAAPQGPLPGYLLTLSCRSPLLKPPRLGAPAFIADIWPDEAKLRDGVQRCIKGIAELRLQMLAPGA